jgi:hypothetical protein
MGMLDFQVGEAFLVFPPVLDGAAYEVENPTPWNG